MPDWTYRTLFRPLLLRIPPERARRFAVTMLSRVGRLPCGPALVDFLGHMRAGEELKVEAAGQSFPGPIGLASFVDPEGAACAALSRFGTGVLEIGPVASVPQTSETTWEVEAEKRTIVRQGHHTPCDAETVRKNLAQAGDLEVPIWIRITAKTAEEATLVVTALSAHASGFVLDTVPAAEELKPIVTAMRGAGARRVYLSAAVDCSESLVSLANELDVDGIVVRAEHSRSDGAVVFGTPSRDRTQAEIHSLRRALSPNQILVAGGILDPMDARRFLDAGANLVLVDAGLVLSGPGLIKRCNEALRLERRVAGKPEPFSLSAARHAWFWGLMLGIALLFGGVLALAIASTRVVLPYDEALCGMSRAQLAALNPRLLPFMAHDRVSLAGSMLSLGILYVALAWHGVRRGQHWAQVATVISTTAGFFSFFTFLGFGYFDPFHAFVTAVLFPMLLLCLVAPISPNRTAAIAEWAETPAWRRGQWGQLLFVVIGVGMTGAGAFLSIVGCTQVFVQEDLDYLGTAAAELFLSSERLLPLVAHDRASLGGMLIDSGLAIWLTAQWGFRAGASWLWQTLAWAGNLAFGIGILVHIAVGYFSLAHLLPAIVGWALWWLALWLCRDWLIDRVNEPEQAQSKARG